MLPLGIDPLGVGIFADATLQQFPLRPVQFARRRGGQHPCGLDAYGAHLVIQQGKGQLPAQRGWRPVQHPHRGATHQRVSVIESVSQYTDCLCVQIGCNLRHCRGAGNVRRVRIPNQFCQCPAGCRFGITRSRQCPGIALVSPWRMTVPVAHLLRRPFR